MSSPPTPCSLLYYQRGDFHCLNLVWHDGPIFSLCPTSISVWSRGYGRYSGTPIHMQPMGGRRDIAAEVPAQQAPLPSASPPQASVEPPAVRALAWSPMRSTPTSAGSTPRTGFKRARVEEGGNESAASLVGSGLGATPRDAPASAKRQALSRLGAGDRRTWRAGLTPHPASRLPAPSLFGGSEAGPSGGAIVDDAEASAAQLSSLAARRILISLETVQRVRSRDLDPSARP